MTTKPRIDRLARERGRRAKAAQTAAVAVKPPRLQPWQPARPGEEIEISFLPGLTVHDEGAIAQMQKNVHDGLIQMLGPKRRSGIRWRHVHGRAESERILRLMYEDDPVKWPDVVAHYFPFLAEHGDNAVMVVAECEAVR